MWLFSVTARFAPSVSIRLIIRFCLLSFCIVASIASAEACSVPVFRYALERWERDLYQIIVVKDGAFTEAEVQRAQALQADTVGGEGFLNAVVSLADISSPEMRQTLAGMYPSAIKVAKKSEGTLTLFYPRTQQDVDHDAGPIWEAPFTDASVAQVEASAAYHPLAEALLSGASTVFLFMESGDAEVDAAALEQLEESLGELEHTMEIPEGIINTKGDVTGGRLTAEEARAEDPSNQLKSGIPLKIAFEIIRMGKAEAESAVLRQILLKMQPGLSEETDAPMVFPFFGRGRVLPPMRGEMIHHENIEAAAQYLCGACSCQMKAQNPGIDSLTNLDWFRYLDGGEVMREVEVPALSGFLPEAPARAAANQSQEEVPARSEASAPAPLARNAFIAGGVLLGALIVASIFVMRSHRQPNP